MNTFGMMASVAMLCAAAGPVCACSPPTQRESAGFVRHDIGSLPKNARGVMFISASRLPRQRDFVLQSDRDARPLAVRVRVVNGGEVRLEPVHGFQAGAHYTFRYLPAHGAWQYPDAMRVLIDDRQVATSGKYALALAPRPLHRIVVVPGGTACVQPVTAVTQEFTYAVPPALAPYAASLDYGADVVTLPVTAARVTFPMWPVGPVVYSSLAPQQYVTNPSYTSRRNAVIAPCGARLAPARLLGWVRFPEMDDRIHATQQRRVELNRHVDNACGTLEALLSTVAGQPFESALRAVCRSQMAGSFSMDKQPLRTLPPEEWAFQLGFLYDMSPTCNLVGLAHILRGGHFSADPMALDTIGAALKQGLGHARPAEWDEAVHALHYLVRQLPTATQAATAQRLLGPSRPLLVKALAVQRPGRPEDLARLIALSAPVTLRRD